MVALTFVVSIAAVLLSPTVIAAPSPAAQSEKRAVAHMEETRDVNPYSGVSMKPYAEASCSGDSQGNTNVNQDTTACVNVTNAKSFHLRADCCTEAEFSYYSETDCQGDLLFTHLLNADTCYPKTNGAVASMRISPGSCSTLGLCELTK